jgi:UrcA family protein
MTISNFANAGRTGLLVTFAVGALAIISARANAAAPDEIAISPPTVKTVGHDSATGAPIEETTVKSTVQFDPVTLTTNSGVALLEDSVLEAAREACDSAAPLDDDGGACVRSAVRSAQSRVDGAIARAR